MSNTERNAATYYAVDLPPQPDSAYGPRVLPWFDAKLVTSNIRSLKALLRRVETNPVMLRDTPDLKKAYPLINYIVATYDRYQHIVPKLAKSLIVDEHLAASGNLVIKSGEADTNLQVADKIHNYLNRATQEVVLLSQSHVSGYSELIALSDFVAKKGGKVGAIIEDRHADIYSNPSSGKNQVPNKGNFLRLLLQEQVIDSAAILGVAEYFRNALENQTDVFNPGSEYNSTALFYIANQDKLIITSDAMYYDIQSPNLIARSFNKKKFKKSVVEVLDQFKKNGVTHVFIQLDVDSLRLDKIGYTPPDYSPLNYYLNLGIQELNLIPDWQIVSALRQAIALKPGLGYAGKFLHNLHFGENPLNSVGLPLAATGIVLETVAQQGAEMGISFGVDLPSGGSHVLSVTELANPDVGGKISRVIRHLSNKVHRLRQTSDV